MARTALLLSILLLAGCSKTSGDAARSMLKAACAGESDTFFAQIDRESLRQGFVDAARKGGEAAGSYAALHQIAPAAVDRKIQEVGQQAFTNAMLAWESDVKRGQAGDWCRMSVVRSSDTDKSGEVFLRTGSGKDKRAVFTRYGDRWLLVSFGPAR